MKVQDKLRILADAAKYDASCSSSGSKRVELDKGIGNAAASGICHSWASDGRCVSLFKILLTNECLYDCSYCLSRRSNTIERARFTPEEIVDLTINFYIRNYIEGLFLSSAVYASPDQTMADMVEVCTRLRQKKFYGYIHLKVIPGCSAELVRQAGLVADRLSVNIELPSENSLKLLAPQKSKHSLMAPMRQIGEEHSGFLAEQKKTINVPKFCPAGQTTQMIVGASQENDLHILHLSENLYKKMEMKRVYYSAYIPVNTNSNLPSVLSAPPLIREHRLYQADWLLRFYRFKAGEILSQENPDLDERMDPKAAWALRNFDHFPIDVHTASYDMLLRVPGLGPLSAQRIVATRRVAKIREQDLRKIGLVMKRARHFLRLGNTYLGDIGSTQPQLIAAMCKAESPIGKKVLGASKQLKLF